MSRWFRFYDDAINDPKILRLSDEAFRGWVALLCVASKSRGVLPSMEDLAFYLRIKPQKVALLIAELVAAGLLDKTDNSYAPHNWAGRQYVSDSTERVKRHREKRAAAGLAPQWQPSKELRQSVYARDDHQCVYCGSVDDLTIDHKTPELRGGTHDFENLHTACRPCNASKRDLTHEEFVARSVTSNASCNADSNADVTPLKRPQSTESEQSRAEQSAAPANSRRKPKLQMPDIFPLSEKNRVYAGEKGLGGIEQVFAKFKNYHQSKGSVFASWDAAWRTWVDNEISFKKPRAEDDVYRGVL